MPGQRKEGFPVETPLFLSHPFKAPVSDRDKILFPPSQATAGAFQNHFMFTHSRPESALEKLFLTPYPKSILARTFPCCLQADISIFDRQMYSQISDSRHCYRVSPPRCLLGMRPFYYFAVLHALLKLAHSRVSGISQRMKNEKSRPGGRPFP